jgi:hypothetical protein
MPLEALRGTIRGRDKDNVVHLSPELRLYNSSVSFMHDLHRVLVNILADAGNERLQES